MHQVTKLLLNGQDLVVSGQATCEVSPCFHQNVARADG